MACLVKMFHTTQCNALAFILMAIIFLVSGMGKLVNVEETQEYMEAYGVPGELLWPAAAFEIASGLALISGLLTTIHDVCLAGWCILTAVIFHTDFQDPNQKINFMKNLAMAGGFLVLAERSAWCGCNSMAEMAFADFETEKPGADKRPREIESSEYTEKTPLLAQFQFEV